MTCRVARSRHSARTVLPGSLCRIASGVLPGRSDSEGSARGSRSATGASAAAGRCASAPSRRDVQDHGDLVVGEVADIAQDHGDCDTRPGAWRGRRRRRPGRRRVGRVGRPTAATEAPLRADGHGAVGEPARGTGTEQAGASTSSSATSAPSATSPSRVGAGAGATRRGRRWWRSGRATCRTSCARRSGSSDRTAAREGRPGWRRGHRLRCPSMRRHSAWTRS